ncbi:hypothetical protein DQ04_11351030 [Trypanosoma grayi]|uniref:hypothetical protein n=1 Tax=Trypanosoma grayi TaxID=71804 RepID=UPI0004F49B22|nr:hypothetical protein DQ04_11351030 [Trypanosoma grayi]KEG06994.1 hypothetical protein DQ04_11351030 [Trypanosoma grayi]
MGTRWGERFCSGSLWRLPELQRLLSVNGLRLRLCTLRLESTTCIFRATARQPSIGKMLHNRMQKIVRPPSVRWTQRFISTLVLGARFDHNNRERCFFSNKTLRSLRAAPPLSEVSAAAMEVLPFHTLCAAAVFVFTTLPSLFFSEGNEVFFAGFEKQFGWWWKIRWPSALCNCFGREL